jgi:CRP-like cAMP-binding protein
MVDKTKALAQSALGVDLDESECEILAAEMGVETFGKGDRLVDEGDDRRTLFVLVDGAINVCSDGGSQPSTVYRMRRGEVAGTRAFLDGTKRKATLVADGDGSVLTLEPDRFEPLIEQHPRLVYKVMRAFFHVTHTNLMRVNLESAELRNYTMKTGGRY